MTVSIAISRKTRGRPRVDGDRGPFLALLVKRPKVASSTIDICYTQHWQNVHRLRAQSSTVTSLALRLDCHSPTLLRLSTTTISFCWLYLNADHAAISTIRVRGLVEAIRKKMWETPNLFDMIWQKNDVEVGKNQLQFCTCINFFKYIHRYIFNFINTYFIEGNLNFDMV